MLALVVAVSLPVFLVPFVASCLLMLGLVVTGVTRAVQGFRIYPHWSLGHLLVQGDPSLWSVPEAERLRPRTVDGALQLPASWRAGVLVQRWMLLPLAAFLMLLAMLNLTSGQESGTDKVGNAVLLIPPAIVLAWIGWTSGRSRTVVTATTVKVTSTWGVRRVVARSDLVDVVHGRRRPGERTGPRPTRRHPGGDRLDRSVGARRAGPAPPEGQSGGRPAGRPGTPRPPTGPGWPGRRRRR